MTKRGSSNKNIKGLLYKESAGQGYILRIDTQQIYHLNKTANVIFKLLRARKKESEVLEYIFKHFNVCNRDKKNVLLDIKKTIASLKKDKLYVS